jgi:SagB-type dehydrogenase family enzyme
MEALNCRQTNRAFSTQDFNLQELSNLLWAAFGVNRAEEKKRTAPSATNAQEIDIYLSNKNGIYKYDAFENMLIAIQEGDHRSVMGKQNFVGDAPIVLIYVADFSKMTLMVTESNKVFYSATDAGFISQNVYLYAASENLATVVIGMINNEKIGETIGINKKQRVILTQPVGFNKE